MLMIVLVLPLCVRSWAVLMWAVCRIVYSVSHRHTDCVTRNGFQVDDGIGLINANVTSIQSSFFSSSVFIPLNRFYHRQTGASVRVSVCVCVSKCMILFCFKVPTFLCVFRFLFVFFSRSLTCIVVTSMCLCTAVLLHSFFYLLLCSAPIQLSRVILYKCSNYRRI